MRTILLTLALVLVMAVAALAQDYSGKWRDPETGDVYTIQNNRLVDVRGQDTEIYTILAQSIRPDEADFAIFVPSTNTVLTWECKAQGPQLKCWWYNSLDADGWETLSRTN